MTTTRLRFGEYEAWITIEGEGTEHYSVETDEDAKTVTCWIASEEGKHFELWSRKDHERFSNSMKVTLDGVDIPGVRIKKEKTSPALVRGVPTTHGTIKQFVFSRLEVTDDESTIDNRMLNDVGEIRITLRRAEYGPPEKMTANTAIQSLSGSYKVNERSKKAMVHRVQCDTEVPRTMRSVSYPTRYYECLATFILRYRSLDMLQANGIAPPPTLSQEEQDSSPPRREKRKAPEVKEEEDEDEGLEIDEVQRKLDQLLAETSRLKAVIDSRQFKRPPKKKVKEEPKPTFISGEVIDLT